MAPRTLKGSILLRINILYCFLIVAGACFILKVALLQMLKGGTLQEEADRISISTRVVDSYRGDILADDGRVLATSVPSYDVFMDPCASHDTTFRNNIAELARRLARFPGNRTAAGYQTDLETARKNRRRYVALARHVNFLELKEIKTYPILRLGQNRGGLIIETFDSREHPYGGLADRTIGFYTRDQAGNFPGLEGAYNTYLTGKAGMSVIQRLAGGISIPIDSESNTDPENGGDVVSTINIEIQDAAETALRRGLIHHHANHGTVVIMEVATGAVKAICNLGEDRNGNYRELYNYALGEAVDPGSTFKLMSYMRALEDGFIEPEDTIDNGNGTVYFYNKRVWDDGRAATMGKLTIEEAFAQSSNVSVTKIIDRFYRDREAQFIEGLYAFHLNDTLGLDIRGEAHPYIKHPKGNDYWSKLSLTQIAYGYEMRIAPIHTLTFYNAVANDGKMVKPMFVKELRKQDATEKTFKVQVIDAKICSSATLKKARHMLESVVNYGTAKGIRSDVYKIAGKTGTAQIANEKYGYADKRHYASFVGYFPADHPLYSGIVTVYDPKQNGSGGGVVAAPIFREIADKIYASSMRIDVDTLSVESASQPLPHPGRRQDLQYLLSRLRIGSPKGTDAPWVGIRQEGDEIQFVERNTEDRQVPNVVNMGLKDALFLLEHAGLTVQVNGSGYVRRQSLQPGQPVRTGQTISVECGI